MAQAVGTYRFFQHRSLRAGEIVHVARDGNGRKLFRNRAGVAGRRMVAVDGTCLDLADSPANDAHFGRPGVNKGEKSAFPQARLVALAECGTHSMFAARIAPYREGEPTLIEPLLDALAADMLLLADRGIFSYALWRKASQTGADLLWRVRTGYRAPDTGHRNRYPCRNFPTAPGWPICARATTPRVSRCGPG